MNMNTRFLDYSFHEYWRRTIIHFMNTVALRLFMSIHYIHEIEPPPNMY